MTRYGYKVMRYDGATQRIVSGADSRLHFALKKGAVVEMPGAGIWLALDRQYVIDHYAIHDCNALIRFRFDSSAITAGNLTDREPEFATPKATIVDFEIAEEF